MEGRRSEIMLKNGGGGGGVHGKSIPSRTADVIAGFIELMVDKCFPLSIAIRMCIPHPTVNFLYGLYSFPSHHVF